MERRDFFRKSLLAAAGSVVLGSGLVKAVENLNTKNNGKMKITVLTGSPRRNGHKKRDMKYSVSTVHLSK